MSRIGIAADCKSVAQALVVRVHLLPLYKYSYKRSDSMLTRQPNENELEYHKRLVYGKLIDKTLADEDYSELASYVYGKDYSSDVARRMMYGSCKTLQLIDQTSEKNILSSHTQGIMDELNAKKIELQKERQKFFDQRTAFNKVVRERARQEELNEIIVDSVLNGKLMPLEYEPANIDISDNDILVSLNDIHFGAVVENYWQKYNSDICRKMLCKYLDDILLIARTHSSENCVVWANGDLISGNIHNSIAVTNKENVIEQITGVSELIAEFLAELSRHFNKVSFVSVSGNHSRIDAKDRALMKERLDDLVEWYLKARLQHFENIVIGDGERIDCSMYLIDIRDKTYCGVHGDYEPNSAKIQALQQMAGKQLYAVLLGHLHHNKTDTVQGIKTIMAGSFLGMDDFCVQKRIVGEPEQLICICDKNGIRCTYDIKLRV